MQRRFKILVTISILFLFLWIIFRFEINSIIPYVGFFILSLWIIYGTTGGLVRYGQEYKKLVNSLYEHKLWFKRIQDGTYPPLKDIPFVDLETIENTITTNGLSTELNVYIVSYLESHLQNIENLENEIQTLQANNAIKEIQNIKTSFAYKNLIKEIKSAESLLDECLIYLEQYGEATQSLRYFRRKFVLKPRNYFIEDIKKKMQEYEHKDIRIKSDIFACLSCKSLFSGKICPICDSKLKVRVKNPIK